jgi:hypothetical protein
MKNTIVIRDDNDNRYEYKMNIKTKKELITFLKKIKKEKNIKIAVGFITNNKKYVGFCIDKDITINNLPCHQG